MNTLRNSLSAFRIIAFIHCVLFAIYILTLLSSCGPKFPCDKEKRAFRKSEQQIILPNSVLIDEVRRIYANSSYHYYLINNQQDTLLVSNYSKDVFNSSKLNNKVCKINKGDVFELSSPKSKLGISILPNQVVLTSYQTEYFTIFDFEDSDFNFKNNVIRGETIENSILFLAQKDSLCFQKDSGFIFINFNALVYVKN